VDEIHAAALADWGDGIKGRWRLLAALEFLDDAAPMFRSELRVPRAGVLPANPNAGQLRVRHPSAEGELAAKGRKILAPFAILVPFRGWNFLK